MLTDHAKSMFRCIWAASADNGSMRDVIRVVAAVIERDGRYLITQRKPGAVLPCLWEFPGGRVEDDEIDEVALVREVEHRIGVRVIVGARLAEHVHEYEAYDVHLSMFECTIPPGREARPVGVEDVRWVASAEMDEYEFPPADQQTMSRLLGMVC